MNYLVPLLLVCLLFVGCTQTPTQGCQENEIQRSIGGPCCLDLDADGVCDDLEEDVQVVEPIVPEPSREELIAEEIQENQPLVEESEDVFTLQNPWENVKHFSYYLDHEEYGKIWIWQRPGREEFIPVEWNFLNNFGIVTASQFHYANKQEAFINGIRDRNLYVMNFIWRVQDTYTACYVQGSFYSEENCIGDWPNGNAVIQYAVQFDRPASPLDFLEMVSESTPETIEQGRTYVINGEERIQIKVELLTFLVDETEVVLYLHETYGVPVQVDITEEGLTTEYVFEGIEFNAPVPVEGVKLAASYRD